MTVTEPTTLTVNPTSGSYYSPTTISGVLTDANTGLPVPGEPVVFTVAARETCTGTDRRHRHRLVQHHAQRASATYTVDGQLHRGLQPTAAADRHARTRRTLIGDPGQTS